MSYIDSSYRTCVGQLGRQDFANEQNKEKGLKIYPFDERCQKAASYDLTPTIIAMSVKMGMLETVYLEKNYFNDKYYIYVRAKDTVLIVSNEYLLVPTTMAGYVSSRVSKVGEGFGHISTTIDPNWSGAALIAISNPSNQMLKIYVGANGHLQNGPYNLATITFHYLNTPCESEDKEKKHCGMRLDLLQQIKYTNKKGVRAFIRQRLHYKRREFTDYFFAASKMLENGFSEECWDNFLNDFSYLKATVSSDEIKSKKAKKIARDFIVSENIFIRFFHFLGKYIKLWQIIFLLVILFLQSLGISDSFGNIILYIFQKAF